MRRMFVPFSSFKTGSDFVVSSLSFSVVDTKTAFAILRDESSKSLLLLVRGTHSINDTLTAATGAMVPFHHSLVDQGGVTKLVLGYAHCGMVAGARWIAKCTIPCVQIALSQNPDYKIKGARSVGAGIVVPAEQLGCLPVEEVFRLAVTSFKVHDWNLFGGIVEGIVGIIVKLNNFEVG